MSDDLLLGLGLVAVIEGLVLSLAPRRVESMLTALRELGPDRVRAVGLSAVAAGVVLVWLARA